MDSQKLVKNNLTYAATLAAGEVSSLRITEDERTTVRVYDGGFIGVAGRIGAGDDAALMAQAQGALAQKIPYPDAVGTGEVRQVNLKTQIIAEGDFLNTVRRLAARLKERFPRFIFSDKFYLDNGSITYTDTAGTKLSFSAGEVAMGLSIKAAGSANIMDLWYGASRDYYDEDAVVADIAQLLDVYENKLPLPECDVPVIIETSAVQYILRHLVAEMYSSGASLFSGKLGEKLFGGEVDLLIDRTPGRNASVPFFDTEGVTLPEDKFYFIKEGTLCGLATYKRSAAMLNMPLSGSGYATFDGVPQCGNFGGLKMDTHGKKLSEVPVERAIYVAVTSGGDMTPDGNLAMPVMLAYLYEGGRFVGTLPEFGISAGIFDLLGKDLIAVAENDIFGYRKEDVIVTKFSINR